MLSNLSTHTEGNRIIRTIYSKYLHKLKHIKYDNVQYIHSNYNE